MKNKKILYSVIAIVIVITSVFLINNKINKGKETIEAETITDEPIINVEKEKDTNKANFDLINLDSKEESKEEPKIINIADIPVVPEPEIVIADEPETEITDTTEVVEVVEVEEVAEVVEVPEIEEVEEVKPTPAPKKEETKKKEPKKETPKKETPKKETPKKETPKKEEKKPTPTPEPTKAPEPVKEEVKPNKNNKTEVLGVEIVGAGSFRPLDKEYWDDNEDLYKLEEAVFNELTKIQGKGNEGNGLFLGSNAITMNFVGSNANSIELQKDKENNTYKLTFKVSLKTADDEYKNNIANLNRAVLKAMMYKVSNYGEELYEAILDSWSGDEIYGIDTDKWVKINDVEVQYVKGGSYIIRKAK